MIRIVREPMSIYSNVVEAVAESRSFDLLRRQATTTSREYYTISADYCMATAAAAVSSVRLHLYLMSLSVTRTHADRMHSKCHTTPITKHRMN